MVVDAVSGLGIGARSSPAAARGQDDQPADGGDHAHRIWWRAGARGPAGPRWVSEQAQAMIQANHCREPCLVSPPGGSNPPARSLRAAVSSIDLRGLHPELHRHSPPHRIPDRMAGRPPYVSIDCGYSAKGIPIMFSLDRA